MSNMLPQTCPTFTVNMRTVNHKHFLRLLLSVRFRISSKNAINTFKQGQLKIKSIDNKKRNNLQSEREQEDVCFKVRLGSGWTGSVMNNQVLTQNSRFSAYSRQRKHVTASSRAIPSGAGRVQLSPGSHDIVSWRED